MHATMHNMDVTCFCLGVRHQAYNPLYADAALMMPNGKEISSHAGYMCMCVFIDLSFVGCL